MLSYIKTNWKFFAICFICIGAIFAYVFTRPEVIDTSNQIIELNNKEKQKAIELANLYKSESEKIHAEFVKSEAATMPLKAEIQRLKGALAQAEARQETPGGQEASQPTQGDPTASVSILKSLVEKQDTLIASQEKDISLLNKENLIIKSENAQLRIAINECNKNENIRRIEAEAQLAAIKSARWRGRTEGFTVAAIADLGLRLAHVF